MQMLFDEYVIIYRIPIIKTEHTCWSHLTHLPRDKMAAISQTTFSSAFSWKKISKFLFKFHQSLFFMAQLTINSTLVQVMAWHRTGENPSPEPMLTQFTDAYITALGLMSSNLEKRHLICHHLGRSLECLILVFFSRKFEFKLNYKETLHKTIFCFVAIAILTHHNRWPHNCCWQWSAGRHHAPGPSLADQPLKITTMYVQWYLSDETGQIYPFNWRGDEIMNKITWICCNGRSYWTDE